MNEFKKIGIIYKPDAVGVLAICEKIKNFFFSKHFVTIVSEINNPAKNIDLAIIVGGVVAQQVILVKFQQPSNA